MGRNPKPWQRKQDGAWYATLDGRKVKLATKAEGHAVAAQRFHEAKAAPKLEPGPLLKVADLCEEFLGWVDRNRSAGTLGWYRDHLSRFVRHIGDGLLVAQLRPYHVERWVAADYAGKSSNYRRGAMRTTQRVCNWAVGQGYLRSSPIATMEKPPQTAREYVIEPADWRRIIEASTGPFVDVLQFLYLTGARPQEVKIIEARHFDGRRIAFERPLSKGKKYNRSIELTDEAEALIRRLIASHPTGPIFRNSRGVAWTKNALACRVDDLKTKLNLPQLCCGAVRHTFITRAVKSGVDATVVAKLVGHRSITTLAKNYLHLAPGEFLRAAAEKINADTSGPT